MREEEIGEEVVDKTQINTLDKIISEKDKEDIKIKKPKDEFNDESLSEINIRGFESNSIAYFKEILLGRRTSDILYYIFKDSHYF